MKPHNQTIAHWSPDGVRMSHAHKGKPLRRTAPRPPRVVIADDDALLRESVGLVLSGLCETVGLSSGSGLEDFLENTHADLLILDVNMPGPDGFELCRRLRSHPRWRKLPVLFLTGRGGDIAYDRFLSVRGDAYLTKPFKRNDLVETVIRLLPPEQDAE